MSLIPPQNILPRHALCLVTRSFRCSPPSDPVLLQLLSNNHLIIHPYRLLHRSLLHRRRHQRSAMVRRRSEELQGTRCRARRQRRRSRLRGR